MSRLTLAQPNGQPEARKARGAFFTPPAIASFLARWAIAGRPTAKVLDPTCGDGAFLVCVAEMLGELTGDPVRVGSQVFGVDVHSGSLTRATQELRSRGLDAELLEADFFGLRPPTEQVAELPGMDAIVGNPPFIRYQRHAGEARRLSREAALRQGVRLSGLASSWAALLIHAGGFLNADGRLAMVLPAELLTVGYAEPVRQWLRRCFAAVKLVMFDRLQFDDALEEVVLLLAHGSGGCDAFSLYYVSDAADLLNIQPFDGFAVTLAPEGKWTDMLLSVRQRQLFKHVTAEHFTSLSTYGAPTLGTVTGANDYFTLGESTRLGFGLREGDHVVRISPPGTRHLRGAAFTSADWAELRAMDQQVWMLYPAADPITDEALAAYLRVGEQAGIPDAYKCQIRSPWWKPPSATVPDLFFTYMSHRHPRLIANRANAAFVNSMHGLSLSPSAPRHAKDALPLLTLNSVTFLGAELYGRAYGGGILKMEPREAASLPVPNADVLQRAWAILKPERDRLDTQLRNGLWTNVVARVDEVLLRDVLQLPSETRLELQEAARSLRARRMGRGIRE